MTPEELEQMKSQQQPGLFSRIGASVKESFASPDFRDRLIIGLQGMTTNPNQAMMQMAQQNIEARREKRLQQDQANKSIEFLRARGVPEAELQALANNPQMLMQYVKALLQKEAQKSATPKTFAPQTDPNTGQVYIVQDGKRVDVTDAIQLTPQQRAELETQQAARQADIIKAQEKAEEAMKQASAIESKLPLYQDIIRSIDEGADSGIIMSRLPATNEATAALRSAANQLGITVINSATFGALSESELNLALSTEIPQNLTPERLRQYVAKRFEAQAKLANEIRNKARRLATSGMTYTDYIRQSTMADIPTTLPEIRISEDDSDVVELQ